MKFTLVVEDCIEGDGARCEISLSLEGNECEEEAINRFRDALSVFRHKLAGREGRGLIMCGGRIDGRPTQEVLERYEKTKAELKASGMW